MDGWIDLLTELINKREQNNSTVRQTKNIFHSLMQRNTLNHSSKYPFIICTTQLNQVSISRFLLLLNFSEIATCPIIFIL
jgi:hypothetical protein